MAKETLKIEDFDSNKHLVKYQPDVSKIHIYDKEGSRLLSIKENKATKEVYFCLICDFYTKGTDITETCDTTGFMTEDEFYQIMDQNDDLRFYYNRNTHRLFERTKRKLLAKVKQAVDKGMSPSERDEILMLQKSVDFLEPLVAEMQKHKEIKYIFDFSKFQEKTLNEKLREDANS